MRTKNCSYCSRSTSIIVQIIVYYPYLIVLLGNVLLRLEQITEFNFIFFLGKRYNYDDKEILRFGYLLEEIQENVNRILIADFFPWIKYVVPKYLFEKFTKVNVYEVLTQELSQFLKVLITNL